MLISRRNLVISISTAAAAALANARAVASQNPVPFPPPVPSRKPADPLAPDDVPPPPGSNPTKAMLDQNQKELRKNVERLYDLASELKAEVEKTDATAILSVPMLKKAEEIEKLAKQIKDRAKG